MKQILIYIVFLVVGMVTGWLCRNHFRDEVEMVQIDSIVIRDTIREYQPIEIHKETIDTMLVFVREEIVRNDTTYITLPLERKVYASDEYYAEVTGYRPSLDYIEVFPKTKIITRYVKGESSKWRYSIDVGIDAGRGLYRYISPVAGAEIGYNRWAARLEAGCIISAANPCTYYQAGVKYSIIQKR